MIVINFLRIASVHKELKYTAMRDNIDAAFL